MVLSLTAVGMLPGAGPAAALTPEQEAALRAAAEAGTVRSEAARLLSELAPEGCGISSSFAEIVNVIASAVQDPADAALAALDAEEGAAPLLRERACPGDTRRQELVAMGCQLLAAGVDSDAYLRALFESARGRAVAGASFDSPDIVVTLDDALDVCALTPDARARIQEITTDTGFTEFAQTLREAQQPAPPVVGAPGAPPAQLPRVRLPSSDAPGRAGVSPS